MPPRDLDEDVGERGLSAVDRLHVALAQQATEGVVVGEAVEGEVGVLDAVAKQVGKREGPDAEDSRESGGGVG